VRGEIEKNDSKVLVIKRIFVTYHLRCEEDERKTVERVLGFHAQYCPVAASIKDSIEIHTNLEYVE
jgi:uncharacterized OsmC-like protein